MRKHYHDTGNDSKVDALNKLPFIGSKDLTGIAFPFYMIVKASVNSLMPEKWDATTKSAKDKADDYKKGDVVKVVGLEQNTLMKDKWLMLITDDNNAIWSEGLKPEEVLFSASITPTDKESAPFRLKASSGVGDLKQFESSVSSAFESSPSWAKILPIVGMGVGLLWAYNKKKSLAAHFGYAIVGGMAFCAPLNYYDLLSEEKMGNKKQL